MGIIGARMSYELHDAVLKENVELVESLSKDPGRKFEKNTLGFTPFEIAVLLGKKRCIEILSTSIPKQIQVVPHKETTIHHFSEKEFAEFFQISYAPTLFLQDYATLQKVIKNCPWSMRRGPLFEELRDLAVQFRKLIFRGYTAPIRIQWAGDKLGYGAFANEDILPEAFVGEYAGCVRQFHPFHQDLNGYCFYYPKKLFSLRYFVIDGLKHGNEMRFVNHSDNPNLTPKCLIDRGLLHIVLFAKEKISAGTELTFDYGKDYWRFRKKLS